MTDLRQCCFWDVSVWLAFWCWNWSSSVASDSLEFLSNSVILKDYHLFMIAYCLPFIQCSHQETAWFFGFVSSLSWNFTRSNSSCARNFSVFSWSLGCFQGLLYHTSRCYVAQAPFIFVPLFPYCVLFVWLYHPWISIWDWVLNQNRPPNFPLSFASRFYVNSAY